MRRAQRPLGRPVYHARHLRLVADDVGDFRHNDPADFSSSRRPPGSATSSPTTWASTASHVFVVLTAFLMPFCILASWESIEDRVKEYMIAFLVLETLMIGVFCALDLVLFYLFFEGGLIPMFLIIGVWGGKRRVYASFKFFLYTLLGSVLMLLAILAMYWHAGTTDIPTLLTHRFPPACRPGCGSLSSPPSR